MTASPTPHSPDASIAGGDGQPFSEAEYLRFVQTILGQESLNNLTRITSRIDQRVLLKELGKPKCDAMWSEFQKRNPETRP